VLPDTEFHLGPADAVRPAAAVCTVQTLNELNQQRVPDKAPLLAVQVVSSERAAHVERKIGLYLANGSAEVWVVHANHNAVYVHRRKEVTRLSAGDTLVSEALPGFAVPVARFFGA
jgi:Uma2 family endonuclease